MNQLGFLTHAWANLAGWKYKRVPDTSKRQTNCCIAVERILHAAAPHGAWSDQTHRDLMILDGARPWSPMDGVEAAGIGHPVDSPVPGRWHLVQFWGDPVKLLKGHTILYYQTTYVTPSGEPDGYIAEATDAFDSVSWFRSGTLTEKANGREYRMAVLNV